MERLRFAARQGFEPQFSHPECDVLPLDDRAITVHFSLNACPLPFLESKNDGLQLKTKQVDWTAVWMI